MTTPEMRRSRPGLLMFSSSHEPAVAVYPDSDKIGVWVPGGADNLMLRRADGHVPYYDGEGGLNGSGRWRPIRPPTTPDLEVLAPSRASGRDLEREHGLARARS